MLAWRPAPVQATWIGYAGSTGLAEVDYVIADEALVSTQNPGEFVEQIVRLSGGYLSYAEPAELPPLVPPPARENGYVKFAYFTALV